MYRDRRKTQLRPCHQRIASHLHPRMLGPRSADDIIHAVMLQQLQRMLMPRHIHNIAMSVDHPFDLTPKVLVLGTARILHISENTAADGIDRPDHRQWDIQARTDRRKREDMLFESIITPMLAMRIQRVMH